MSISLCCSVSVLAGNTQDLSPFSSYVYWDEGVNLKGVVTDTNIHIGTATTYDFGTIQADDALMTAFPDLDGFHDQWRKMAISVSGVAWKVLAFKVEIDFSNIRDVKDQLFRFTKGSILPHFTFGHMKEPFSMDMLSSGSYLPFMEYSLPTRVFGPFRNLGVAAHGTWKDERVSWATGFFYNTASYGDAGEAEDRISEANGYDFSFRLTSLSHRQEHRNNLLHFGISYLHRFRNDAPDSPSSQLRTRPESHLTNDRLVDSSRFGSQGQDLFSLETAWQHGALLLQGEYFHHIIDSFEKLTFNGWYAQGSWIVTGEARQYRRNGGVFDGIAPEREFRLGAPGWGSIELALRLSQVDLNDKFVQGGKERNLSVGINWYLRKKIRIMCNYIRVDVQDRMEPHIENGTAEILMTRFQVNF